MLGQFAHTRAAKYPFLSGNATAKNSETCAAYANMLVINRLEAAQVQIGYATYAEKYALSA